MGLADLGKLRDEGPLLQVNIRRLLCNRIEGSCWCSPHWVMESLLEYSWSRTADTLNARKNCGATRTRDPLECNKNLSCVMNDGEFIVYILCLKCVVPLLFTRLFFIGLTSIRFFSK